MDKKKISRLKARLRKKPQAPRPPQDSPRRETPQPESPTAPAVTFSNPISVTNSIAAIFGKRGSGKTALARFLATGSHPFNGIKGTPPGKRVVIFDPRYQIEFGTVVSDFDEFFEFLYNAGDSFAVNFRPRYPREEFPLLCRYLRDTPFEDTIFLVDEVSMVTTPYEIPLEFQDIIRFGRHNRIAVVMTAQRPIDVNRDLTAQCNHLFIFNQHEPRDVQYFSGFLGEAANVIPTLQEFEFLYSDFKTAKKIDKNFKID